MTTTAVAADTTAGAARRPLLRRIVAGLVPFDGVLGLVCLAAGRPLGDALDVGTAAVEGTGAVFLLAAAAGAWTLRRGARDARLVAAANAVFAAWCLVVLAADSPNVLGAVLLAASAASAAATAVVEWRLSR